MDAGEKRSRHCGYVQYDENHVWVRENVEKEHKVLHGCGNYLTK
jgi:hypothetical protein